MQMDDPAPRDDTVTVVVVRTGGIAGRRRRWQVDAADEDAGTWVMLIEQCPWDEPCESHDGADRFVWSIRVRTPDAQHERDLPDAALDGPWRTLVDAVRTASASAR